MFKELLEKSDEDITQEDRDTFLDELFKPKNYLEYDKNGLPIALKYDGKHTKEELMQNIMVAYNLVATLYMQDKHTREFFEEIAKEMEEIEEKEIN
jgi:hypothetical protein